MGPCPTAHSSHLRPIVGLNVDVRFNGLYVEKSINLTEVAEVLSYSNQFGYSVEFLHSYGVVLVAYVIKLTLDLMNRLLAVYSKCIHAITTISKELM